MTRWDTGSGSRSLPRYLVAAGAGVVAWTVTALSWDSTRPAVALFFAAVVIAAWNGGFGPGLLASVPAALLRQLRRVATELPPVPYGAGRITIDRDEFSLRIVAEDGVGFELAAALETHRTADGDTNGDTNHGDAASTATHSFGLFDIRERLRHLGCRLEVDAAPGRGARFVVVVPAPEAPPAGPGSTALDTARAEGRTA